jgi:trimeric autotransporter adhesin
MRTLLACVPGLLALPVAAQCIPQWLPSPTRAGRLVGGSALTVMEHAGSARLMTISTIEPHDWSLLSWDGNAWERLDAAPASSILAVFQGDVIAAEAIHFPSGVTRLVRWNGTMWQPLGEEFDNRIAAVTIYDGDLIAAGSFAGIGQTSANRVARWDGTAWQALGTGIAATQSWHIVGAAAAYGADLILAGTFESAGGIPVANIAAWDGAVWRSLGSGLEAHLHALAEHGGQLIAAGNFVAPGIVAASWNGMTWTPLGTLEGTATALATWNGDLIASGAFYDTEGHHRAMRWDGAQWHSLIWPEDSPWDWIHSLAVYQGKLIAAGEPALFQWDAVGWWAGERWHPLTARMTGPVHALAVHEESLIIGGEFTIAGAHDANHIISWDGRDWAPRGRGLDGPVRALLVHDGTLHAAGSFQHSWGTTAGPVARWQDGEWQGLGGLAPVCALAVFNGELIAGGGSGGDGVSRWDGSQWQQLGLGIQTFSECDVSALAVHDGRLIAGGNFSTAGGMWIVNNLAAWDGLYWLTVGAGVNGPVRALAVYEGDLIVGGDFTAAGGGVFPQVAASNIACWDGQQWKTMGDGLNGSVHTLALHDGELSAGGSFNLSSSYGFARWTGSEWTVVGGGVGGAVYAIASYRGESIVGGDFPTVGAAHEAQNLARWGCPPPPRCYANCDGSTTPPILNVDDFVCFINEFAEAQSLPHEQQATHYANCDGSTTIPVLNVDDFTCFIAAFATGCP